MLKFWTRTSKTRVGAHLGALGVAATLVLAGIAGETRAATLAGGMTTGAAVPVPAGLLDFCRRSAADCARPGEDVALVRAHATSAYWRGLFGDRGGPASTRGPALRETYPLAVMPTPDRNETSAPSLSALPVRSVWASLDRINRDVNRGIRRADDRRLHGVGDYWTVPEGDFASGDCEDYVLAKRRALIAAGVPVDVLSIAVADTRWGESHAVLLVATDAGEMVLDNLTDAIVPWSQSDLIWRERQLPGRLFDWVRLNG